MASASQLRQRHDAVSPHSSRVCKPQLAVDEPDWARLGVKANPTLLEQLPDRVAGGAPEDLQWLSLRRDEHELGAVDPFDRRWDPVISASSYSGSGQETPGGTANAMRRVVPALESEKQAADLLVVGGPAERQRSGNDNARDGTDGDERDVVADPADRGRRLVPAGVDPPQGAESERAAAGGGDERAHFVAGRLGHSERLGNRQGPVPEMRFRAEKLDLDAVPGQRVQRQHRFDRCHSSSGDQDAGSSSSHWVVSRLRASLLPPLRGSIRSRPQSRCGEPAKS